MANTISVASSVELMSALATASPGTTILLASGNYGDLNLYAARQPWAQFSGAVTIKSAAPDNPSIFTSVQLNGVKNLTFDGVKFDYVAADGAPDSTHPFYVTGSENITIKNSIFDGDLAHGVSAVVDGYGTGYGVNVTNSSSVTIEHNEFFNWMRAGVFNRIENLTVKDNEVHDLRSDGFDFADVDHVLIEGNYIHDFRTAAGSGDHPDMIQFWTNGTTSPSTDIVIRGNFLNSGAGPWTQSIFMRNDLVDTGSAGLEMYYQNVTVENNVIYNAHGHGITVGETIGLTIENNTILQNPASAPDANSVYIPSIHLADASQDVLIANNIVPTVYNLQLASSTSERTVTGNLFVQSSNLQGANYVGNLFVNALAGATATLEDLKAVQGGIIDRMNVGSLLTRYDGPEDPYNLNSLWPQLNSMHAPTITSNGGGPTTIISLAENTPAVTTVTATDPDSSKLTYSIAGGADATLFTIDATTGALAFLKAPDYEHPTDVGADNTYQVTVQASDGLLTGAQSLSVNVTNVSPETLTGDGGDNTFLGSADREAFSGLSGVDTVSYASATAAVTARLTNPGTNTGFATGDTYSSIENLTGSTFNDKLTGDANANVLDGGAGNDTLNGGAGVDSLIGGLGNDTFVLTDGTDTVSDTGGTDTITSTITRSLASYATIENLTLAGSSAINGTGNVLNNTITGNSAANVLDGGAGNDTLNGGAGVDSLIGGLGNDTFVLDNGTDTVSDTGGSDTITSTITRSLASYAAVENLTLLGSSAINGTGNGLNNVITGNGAANILDGGTGSDTLIGGLGKDTLTGGASNDTFVFKTLQDSSVAAPDLIGDFAVGDKINLSAIDADTGLAGDQAFHIGGGGGHPGDIVASYSSATNLTTVNLYVNNDATIDSVILMTGDHHNLALGDLFA